MDLYDKMNILPEHIRKRLEILLINSNLDINQKNDFIDLYITIFKEGNCKCPK